MYDAYRCQWQGHSEGDTTLVTLRDGEVIVADCPEMAWQTGSRIGCAMAKRCVMLGLYLRVGKSSMPLTGVVGLGSCETQPFDSGSPVGILLPTLEKLLPPWSTHVCPLAAVPHVPNFSKVPASVSQDSLSTPSGRVSLSRCRASWDSNWILSFVRTFGI
jgi:hypothetical protein